MVRKLPSNKHLRQRWYQVSRKNLLEISPHQIDDGHLVGKLPKEVPLEILQQKFSTQSPLKALRARCLECCCSEVVEVRKCTAISCPAWPFRMGINPFRKKTVLSEAERQRRTALLHGERKAAK